jgi:hypothetical protein
MPTVHREGPFRFVIWPADHEPPHVHVYNSDGSCVVEILTGRVRRVEGMRFRDFTAAAVMADENRASLLAAWRRIHAV